ncbi:LLM class flavin-dependent oxidoreductase [Enemella evansiae]|uniref:LLM class flavin-dependent oxidoreductase n=1 Tax=Enemella evansiae TaxID=2016499 RepID=UPI000B978234|nr:LLM class flavin-dependent oxidoreductase [Enemella evansiae]OYO00554.1 LLM class flavin-dependent oxidoreductase [Enemella evansiae]TDO89765.1 luciferase-like monooxygenase [Enemella evansiae]
MTDYGRDLEFGWFADPDVRSARETLGAAGIADQAGLDLIGVQDHPYNSGHLDAWTLLTAIASTTERVRVFPDVANVPLRGAVMLGRAAATLDRISDGRVELGLGTGVFWEGIAALGTPERSRKERVDALEEAVDVLRLWFDSGRRSVSYDGDWYRLRGAHPGPPPIHRIGLWLGALGPRMLQILGSKADGWLPSLAFVPPDKLAEPNARIDDAALAAGRDPAEINRVYNVWGDFSTQQWVDLLTTTTLEHGMNAYVFGVPPLESELRRISDEIAPAVREAVAAERAR